jgi:hypothetical protein
MHKIIVGDAFKVQFDDVVDAVRVTGLGLFDGGGLEYLEVIVNEDFYAELYIEDMDRDWSFVN